MWKALGGIAEAARPGTRIITNVGNAAMTGGMLAHADETGACAAPGRGRACGGSPWPSARKRRHRAAARGRAGLRHQRADVAGDGRGRFQRAAGATRMVSAAPSAPPPPRDCCCASISIRCATCCFAAQAPASPTFRRIASTSARRFCTRHAGTQRCRRRHHGRAGLDQRRACSPVRISRLRHSENRSGNAARGLGEVFEVGKPTSSACRLVPGAADSLSYLMKTHNLKAADIEKLVVRLSHQGANTVRPVPCRTFAAARCSAWCGC